MMRPFACRLQLAHGIGSTCHEELTPKKPSLKSARMSCSCTLCTLLAVKALACDNVAVVRQPSHAEDVMRVGGVDAQGLAVVCWIAPQQHLQSRAGLGTS